MSDDGSLPGEVYVFLGLVWVAMAALIGVGLEGTGTLPPSQAAAVALPAVPVVMVALYALGYIAVFGIDLIAGDAS